MYTANIHWSKSPISFTEKKAVFLKSMDDVVGEINGNVTLKCEASKPRVCPVWRKDGNVLVASSKYELLQTGKLLSLIIHETNHEDSGEYSCDLGTDLAKSKVTIRGNYFNYYYVMLCSVLILFCINYIYKNLT